MIRTAFVSSYPPCRSSVATFTRNLASILGGREIVALYGPDEVPPPPLDVHHRIRRDEPADYMKVADALRGCADVVAIQHDFETWGGPDGSAVLDFVEALTLPVVATLHAVPGSPGRRQRAVLSELVRGTAATVVMSRAAASLLADVYGVDPGRVQVIPHGVPDLPLVDAETIKPAVGMAGRDVLLSFGLLRPGKGCELVLAALPAIVAARPNATYVILGATHPEVLGRDGEAYRESLVALTAELGMGDHVQLVDRFVGRVELTRWLEAADVVLTPYVDLEQTLAATLPYAMAAGRPVVATPFLHAAELLAEGRGVVVAATGPEAWAATVVGLLEDPEARAEIGRRAHAHSRTMTWWQIADQYRVLLDRAIGSRPAPRPSLSPFGLNA